MYALGVVQCVGCRAEIQGKYFSYGSNPGPICKVCIKGRFCLQCDQPVLDDFAEACPHCRTVLPRCAYCGEVHGGNWWQVQMLNQHYTLCQSCGKQAKNFGRCVCCGGLDNLSQVHCCGDCSKEAVRADDPDRLDQLLDEVMEFLKEEFGFNVVQNCSLHLVSKKRFRSKGWNSAGLYTVNGDVRTIHIEEGLPEPLFMATLAHEATHAWQEENCPQQSDELSEGLATWIEFKTLQNLDIVAPEEWFQATLQGPYLSGFLKCCQLEAQQGELGLIQSVKHWVDFP